MKNVSVKGKCWGIDSFEDSLIVGYQPPRPSVEMLSEDGDVLKNTASNSSGDQQFQCPDNIHIDTTTGTARILVPDRGRKTVYMLNIDLQLLKAFQVPSGGSPRGMAAVEGGQVLVVDVGTRTLRLLDLITGRWQTLLGKEEGLERPWCLVYNQAINGLYVGCIGNDIKEYTVSE